jgi:FdhD protein
MPDRPIADEDGAAPSAGVTVRRVRGGRLETAGQSDRVAEETPIALEYNGISHATMLATPTDLEDFALGFSLTEGIIDAASDVRGIDLRRECDGIVVELEISSACAARLRERRRAMAGRTGCGLCGVETLPEVLRPVAPVAAGIPVELSEVLRAMRGLRTRQTLHEETGATHAAGWARIGGELELVREDVGRHNALDKLLGALARQGFDPQQGFVAISSRASYEIVHKAARCGIGVVAALAAPTAHAAARPAPLGMTLIARARGRRFTVVAGADGVQPSQGTP